jgi:hypothetical protein
MTFATRTLLILTLVLTIAGRVSAQEMTAAFATIAQVSTATFGETSTATSTSTAETSPAPVREANSHDVRARFSILLHQSPSELPRILVLDPTLLSNEGFLTGYPALSRFIEEHPEVRRNPGFYLADFDTRPEDREVFRAILETMTILGTFVLIAFALSWLVRTIIEQKRWNRLSRTQAEVHSKLLDRFGTTEELLQYIRTPAGSKFLESAPIPLRANHATYNPPLTRALWSVQIGIIVAAAAVGMLLASGRFTDDTGEGLFVLGVIALSVGVGFVLSAVISMILSRRLGLWQPPQPSETASVDRFDHPGLVK